MASREQRRRSKKVTESTIEMYEKKKKSNPAMWIFSVIILVVIIVTFVGTPIAGNIGGHGANAVFGEYDGNEIVYYDGSFFSDQVASIADRYREAMNEQNAPFYQYQIWRSAYENAVYRTALISELKSSGFRVSSEAVDKAIVTYGPFMENGEFSENLYAQSSSLEKKNIRQRFREDLYYSTFLSDISAAGLNSAEEEFFKDIAAEEKKFRFVTYSYDDFPEESLIEFAVSNADLFRQISLSRITINTDRKDAEAVAAKLEADAAQFSELASTLSSDPYAEKGGEMGSRYYYELKTLFENTEDLDSVFNLKAGEISGLVKNGESWIIYRCDKAPVLPDFSNTAALANVRSYMERFEKGTIEDYLTGLASGFREFAATSSFTEAAADSGLSVGETGFFPILYGTPSINYYGQNIPIYSGISSESNPEIRSAATNEYFLKSAAALESDEISEPLVLNDRIFVLQLSESRAADDTALASIGPMIGYAGTTWQNEHLRKTVLESPKFKDNFGKVYSSVFTN